MARRDILNLTKEVIKVLEKQGESSVRNISIKIGAQWRTTLKSLEFLHDVNVVKEKKGKKTNKEERLFSLIDKKAKYGKHKD